MACSGFLTGYQLQFPSPIPENRNSAKRGSPCHQHKPVGFVDLTEAGRLPVSVRQAERSAVELRAIRVSILALCLQLERIPSAIRIWLVDSVYSLDQPTVVGSM